MEHPGQRSPAGDNPLLEAWRQASRKQDSLEQHQLRQALSHRYSWAIPTPEALETIAALSPILEIGAGTGYWAWLLRRQGAEVIALDQAPVETGINDYHRPQDAGAPVHSWHPVAPAPRDGDPRFHTDWQRHTLLLCWPPYGTSMARRYLRQFRGENLVYIGEAGGGCTGDEEFHEALRRNWTVVSSQSLPNWSRIHDRLYHYRRKAGAGEPAAGECRLEPATETGRKE